MVWPPIGPSRTSGWTKLNTIRSGTGAVRDWARTSNTVRRAVEAVDLKRIALLEKMFHVIGYTGTDAHIRARIMYYHQVGYYAMGVRESQKARWALILFYQRALTGRDK
jgi:hypothetical protein